MHTSCAMMASKVTPPAVDEGAEGDGAEEARGVAVFVLGCLGLSCTVFCLTVTASVSPITVK